MTRLRWLVILVVMALFAAACGGGDDDGDSGAPTGDGDDTENPSGNGDDAGDAPDLPDCPLDALAAAGGPVEIDFWHAMTRVNEEELQRLTDEFNASQSAVKVNLVAYASYPEGLTAYTAGLGTGELPDLFQGEDTTVQLMVDTQTVLPAAACIAADDYDASEILPRVLTRYTVEDVLWPMPFNVSNPILYYNKAAFTKAGLDPEVPPTTLEELRTMSQQIVDSGAAAHGISFKTDAWFFEHWMAKAGHLYVDNDNGRSGRATAVDFGDATGTELFSFLHDMEEDGLLLSTGTGDLDHYLAIPNDQAAMTIDSSAALGTIFSLLSAGQYANVDLGAAAMPGPDSADGGLLVGGGALYIVNQSEPSEQAAAWEYAKFLADAQTQSEWAAATGYLPIREASSTMPPLSDKWVEQPELKVAYDQLVAGADNTATAGPVIGPYGARGEGVRGAVIDAIQAMFAEGATADAALQQAVDDSNAAIEEYNSRIGG